MRSPEHKNVNVNMDSEIADRFAEQVEKRGQKKFRAIEGAIKLWISLPNEVQSLLIASPSKEELREIEEIFAGLRNQLRASLRKFLAQKQHEKRQ